MTRYDFRCSIHQDGCTYFVRPYAYEPGVHDPGFLMAVCGAPLLQQSFEVLEASAAMIHPCRDPHCRGLTRAHGILCRFHHEQENADSFLAEMR